MPVDSDGFGVGDHARIKGAGGVDDDAAEEIDAVPADRGALGRGEDIAEAEGKAGHRRDIEGVCQVGPPKRRRAPTVRPGMMGQDADYGERNRDRGHHCRSGEWHGRPANPRRVGPDDVDRCVDFGPDALRGIVGHVGGVGGEDRAQVVLTALLGTHARASKTSDSDWVMWTRSADKAREACERTVVSRQPSSAAISASDRPA